MAYRIVPTFGTRTRDNQPQLTMDGGGPSPIQVHVTYQAVDPETDAEEELRLCFHNVSKVWWIDGDYEYEAYEEHEDDYEFALIEIANSRYLDSSVRMYEDTTAKHFRIAFDEWGQLNVIAADVVVTAPGRL